MLDNETKKYTMMGRTRFLFQQYKLGTFSSVFGEDGLLDWLVPRDLSITSGKVYYAECVSADIGYVQRIWPPERKISQNNVFDRLLRLVFPHHR